MNNETKLKLEAAGIDVTEIIPADCIVVPKELWNDWAEKIEKMSNKQSSIEAEPIHPPLAEMTIPDAIKIARQEAAKNTGEVRSALTMLADYAMTAEYAMPHIPHNEPAPGDGEKLEKKVGVGETSASNSNSRLPLARGKIGIKSTATAILAWNLSDGLDIVVSGQRVKEGIWNVLLNSHGICIASMHVHGGRQTANNLCLGLRDGLTRRFMKIKSNHANRKAKEVQA